MCTCVCVCFQGRDGRQGGSVTAAGADVRHMLLQRTRLRVCVRRHQRHQGQPRLAAARATQEHLLQRFLGNADTQGTSVVYAGNSSD